MTTKTISPAEARTLIEKEENPLCVDVRTEAEHSAVHVAEFELRPLQTLDAAPLRSSDRPLFLMCRSGARATMASQQIGERTAPTYIIEGGILGWEGAGLPVNRLHKEPLPIERQTQIAIGTLLLIFLGLGWFVHPLFLALIAGMGCGLIFAGVSGTCALGMLIARMPWNRASKQASCNLPKSTA